MKAAVSLPSQTRINRVLRHIHANLSEPLSVESLAALAGWSRWQFQRVFNAHTGQSVAQYVRVLRLSRAAELLLTTRERQLDIALSCGFCSEISFSRSFRQMFGCSPRTYRQRGQFVGLRTPLVIDDLPAPPAELIGPLMQIRLESRDAFSVIGRCDHVQGLFSRTPDFAVRVPRLWQGLHAHWPEAALGPTIGVLGVLESCDQGASFPYWAGVMQADARRYHHAERVDVPAQTYAVIPFQGPLHALDKTLDWFIHHWLPASGYRGCHGYDLEIYPAGFDPRDPHARMEYWVPVAFSAGSKGPIALQR